MPCLLMVLVVLALLEVEDMADGEALLCRQL